MLRFARLPGQALRTVRSVLDDDAEFRARVAASADERQLDRASWLFLTRPEGWREEYDVLRAAASEEADSRRQRRDEARAERRAAQLEETVGRLRDEVDQLRAALDHAEGAVADERGARTAAERERDSLTDRVATLEEERARAVRSLKDTESTAVGRLEEVRALRAEVDRLSAELDTALAAPPVGVDQGAADVGATPAGSEGVSQGGGESAAASPWAGRDPEVVAGAVQRAGRAAALLAEALAEAAAALEGPGEGDGGGAAEGGAAPGREGERSSASAGFRDDGDARGPRPPRRTPVRLRHGLHEGTVEGLEQLLRTPGIVAIVDGYNVAMEGWPSLDAAAQRDSLVAALGSLRSRVPSEVHVVFDGEFGGGRPSVGAPLPVRVHFSPEDVEADDVILTMVADLPTDVAVLVVSSDRRVADGARRLGANAAPSRLLLQLVRR